jgi:hypothetical protein
MSRRREVREYAGIVDDVAFALWRSDLRADYPKGDVKPAYRRAAQWLLGASLDVIAENRRRAKVAVRILGKPTEISGYIR